MACSFCTTRNQDQLMSLDIHIHLKRNKDPKLFRSSSKLRGNHPALSEFSIFVVRTMVFLQVGSMPQPMHHGLQLCPKVGAQQKVVFFFEKLVFKAQEILFCFLILYSIFYAHLSRSTDSHQWHGVFILHVG